MYSFCSLSSGPVPIYIVRCCTGLYVCFFNTMMCFCLCTKQTTIRLNFLLVYNFYLMLLVNKHPATNSPKGKSLAFLLRKYIMLNSTKNGLWSCLMHWQRPLSCPLWLGIIIIPTALHSRPQYVSLLLLPEPSVADPLDSSHSSYILPPPTRAAVTEYISHFTSCILLFILVCLVYVTQYQWTFAVCLPFYLVVLCSFTQALPCMGPQTRHVFTKSLGVGVLIYIHQTVY
jgi:hypothetical protein